MQKNKVIVICGPTASGKTALSIELAKNNNRQDMVEKHTNILNKYEEILGNIKDGNIIFGRSNRIKV